MYVETIKYLITEELFMYKKTEITFRNTMLDVTSLSFSVRCRRPAVIGQATLSNDGDRENRAGHGRGGRRGRYIPTQSSYIQKYTIIQQDFYMFRRKKNTTLTNHVIVEQLQNQRADVETAPF